MKKDPRIYNGKWSLLNKWSFSSSDTIYKGIKLHHCLTRLTKTNLKWIKDLNVRIRNHKTPKWKIERKSFLTCVFAVIFVFFNMWHPKYKCISNKGKNQQVESHEMKNHVHNKNREKGSLLNGENIWKPGIWQGINVHSIYRTHTTWLLKKTIWFYFYLFFTLYFLI